MVGSGAGAAVGIGGHGRSGAGDRAQLGGASSLPPMGSALGPALLPERSSMPPPPGHVPPEFEDHCLI